MVKIRDLGVSAIPGTRYDMAGKKDEAGTQCEACNEGTTCGDPSGCDDQKDRKKKSTKKTKTSPFNDAAVAQLKQQLRQRLDIGA